MERIGVVDDHKWFSLVCFHLAAMNTSYLGKKNDLKKVISNMNPVVRKCTLRGKYLRISTWTLSVGIFHLNLPFIQNTRAVSLSR